MHAGACAERRASTTTMPDTTTLSIAEPRPLRPTAPLPTLPASVGRVVGAPRPAPDGLGELLGRSRAMRELYRRLERVSRGDAPVLLEGETGAGKSLAAHVLHSLAHPSSALFLTFDPAGAPGWPSSAEAAGRGTLYVDEVGDLPPEAQAELWQLVRLARRRALPTAGTGRLRVVCATSRNLRIEVERGRFREDLYRLFATCVVPVPSLRERRDDLPLLIDHFVGLFARRSGKRIPSLDPAVLQALLAHPWEGNVRELRNELERAVLLTPDGEPVRSPALSPDLLPADPAAAQSGAASLRQRSRELEKQLVAQALARNGWNVAATARELGISRVGLSKKLRGLGMRRPRRPGAAAKTS
jgi:DNA-binding NtrC family response regulator